MYIVGAVNNTVFIDKNTIRYGGSTALHYTLLTLVTLFILFKLLYTAQTVTCVPVYILLGKVRTLLEWADDEPLRKMFGVWVSGVEFMTTRALYGANKHVTNPMISLNFHLKKLC